MNELSDRQLDDVLLSWRDDLVSTLSDSEQLTEQIMAHVDDAAPRLSVRPAEKSARQVSSNWRGPLCLAAALTALTAIGLGLSHSQVPSDNRLADLRELAVPVAADVERHTRVLAEMQRMFGDQLQWVAEVENEVSLSVSAVLDEESGGTPLLVRIVVQSESSARPEVVEILTRSEQKVRLAYGQNKSSLDLWAYVLPDGMVLVETSIHRDGQKLQAETLQVPGDAVAVADANGVQTGVVQSVTLLDEEVI